MDTFTIDLHLDKPGLTPGRVDVSTLMEFFKDFGRAIDSELVVSLDGTKPADEDAPALALVGVRGGSAAYSCQLAPQSADSAARIIRGLADRSYGWKTLAPTTQVATVKAFGRLVKKGFTVAIDVQWQPGLNYSAVTAADIPDPDDSLFLRGVTTRRLHVTRAGGIRQPNAVGVLPNGKRVYVRGNKKIVKQLADRLYNDVMVTGTAWWNLTTNALVEMLASKIVDPPAADLDETMRALGGIATAPWNRMTAAEFLKLNRHEGDD